MLASYSSIRSCLFFVLRAALSLALAGCSHESPDPSQPLQIETLLHLKGQEYDAKIDDFVTAEEIFVRQDAHCTWVLHPVATHIKGNMLDVVIPIKIFNDIKKEIKEIKASPGCDVSSGVPTYKYYIDNNHFVPPSGIKYLIDASFRLGLRN